MDDDDLTAEEQAALDAQRNTPEPEDTPVQDAPEAPQEGTEGAEATEGTEPPAEPDKRPQMVPHAALHEERKRRQDLERQAAEDRRRYEARLEEVLKLVPQPAAQPETPQAPAIPDVQADPVGHIVGTLQQLGASQAQIQQAVEQQRAQVQQQQLVMAVQQRATVLEADYKAQNPDYDGDLNYLRLVRDRQLLAGGMTDPGRRAQQIAAETFHIAAVALQEGGNPAERLHQMAKATREASRPAEEPAAQGGQMFGQAQAQASAPDQAERLRMVQRGQEQSRGLGNVRGNGPAPMTAARLLDMDDDAFLEAMKKSKDARRLMGA